MSERYTGYPSIDKPWLKYYEEGADVKANDIPQNKTVWDVIEERLYKHIDIPAIEYFGRKISRKEFIENVYLWANIFKTLGVKENDVVAYYGPFVPDACYMTLALNMLGACPYFLKLAIDSDALAEETQECRIAIVFDQMWGNVSNEFSKDRFETVIIVRITDAMPMPKKQIVSLLLETQKKTRIPKGKKYISVSEAKKTVSVSNKDIKAPFVTERNAFITSSSGTTVKGIVKGTVATNESTISQLYMGENSKINYFPGDRCLNHFPPTASTSLNVLFFLALFKGETVVIDPRVSEKDFYNQIKKLHPNIVLTTGSAWEAFFNRVEKEIEAGKEFDFSYAKGWIVGGEGTDPGKFQRWDEIMKKTNAYNLLFSGYGSSELFSATSCETLDARSDFSKAVMSVGIPYAGIVMGVFDMQGNELSYNQRGELRIKSKSAMKEYYKKPELTAQIKKDGWVCTGDLAEIDENGFIYIWGRMDDSIELPNGREIFLFDLANCLKADPSIDDAIVLKMPVENKELVLTAHIVWDKAVRKEEMEKTLIRLNDRIRSFEPEIRISAYTYHDAMLPYSPTTLKKDKNKMSQQTKGYVQIEEGKLRSIRFVETENGKYRVEKY